MTTAASDPLAAAAAEPMAPDLAVRVTAFARACKAAARAVAFYPADHPAVSAALETVTASARAATDPAALQLAVLPDALSVDGRQMARPDASIAELADLLHRHQIARLSIQQGTDPGLWRRFLALLALPPDQIRLRGGLGRLWATEGEARIELRSLDYNELLRSRASGERATWEAIVSGCLEDHSFAPDEALVDLLFGVIEDPARIASVMETIEARLPSAGATQRGPMILAGLLQAVAQFATTSSPDTADAVMAALAEATTRLPLEALGPIIEAQHRGSRPSLSRFVQGLIRHMGDTSIASLIANEVRDGRGASPRLADAFCGLAPGADRRFAIVAMARGAIEQSGAAANPSVAQAWQQFETMLLAYSNASFVSATYQADIDRLVDRAVDLEKDHTDPPAVVAEWCDTVDEDGLRLLDAGLIADLMNLQQDEAQWRDLAGLALQRVSALLIVGDFAAAAHLAEALRAQSETHPDPGVRTAAGEVVLEVLTLSTMRHVASHLDTADRTVVRAAQRFCMALGTSVIGPLAEVLSREERSRPRTHLINTLIAFGAPGRQSVELLRHSPNEAVRRTAVQLLREFGGHEALPELASLLGDAELRVQREATRAIALLGTETAYDTLIHALDHGAERTRSAIIGVLWTLPAEDAGQFFSHFVWKAPCHGAMWEIHARAIDRLGLLGGRHSVSALASVLQRRQFWSPFRMAALHRCAIDALGRLCTPEALAVIETVGDSGSRLVRSAARRRLGTAISAADHEGRIG